MKKLLPSLFLLLTIMEIVSCSKSSDPASSQKTALDSVKSAITGSWKFNSLTLTQTSTGKSKTLTTCDRSSMYNYYTTDNPSSGIFGIWIQFTPEFNYVFNSDGTASESNACFTASTGIIVSTSKNPDNSVNVSFNDAINKSEVLAVYQVRSKDITTTTVKAILVSDGLAVAASQGYLSIITFTRQ